MKIRASDLSKVVRASLTVIHSSDTLLPPHNKQHSSARIPSGLSGPSAGCCAPPIRLLYSRLVQLAAGLRLWSQAQTEDMARTEHYICTKYYPLKY
jgi:hypothetical protein